MTYVYGATRRPLATKTTAGPRTGFVALDLIRFHPHNVRVDLGDLRALTESIREFGVMQPIVLEQRGDSLRVRSGHRRVAAARQAGLTRIPAVVHPDALDDTDWLRHAVHENTRRRGMDAADRARAVHAMHDAGMSHAAIGADLGISPKSVSRILHPDTPSAVTQRRGVDRVRVAKVRAVLDEQRDLHRNNEVAATILAAIEAVLPPRADA